MTHMKTYFYRSLEKAQCYALVTVVTPGFYIFEMTVVRPKIVEIYQMGDAKHVLHILLSSFCFINIAGNMLMSIFVDSCTKKTDKEGIHCDICNINRPKEAWHCKSCDVCVLNRDHHCFFFAKCIGLRNKRYYLLYLIHVTTALVYCTYYNYYYVCSKFEESDMMISALRIINPMVRYLVPEPMGMKDLCLLFLLINIGLVVWTGLLTWFHIRNAVRGVTARDSETMELFMTSKWRENLLKIFGVKWYLAVIWPFAESPLLEVDID